MPDETFRINVEDNFDETAQRAQTAKRAIDDLNQSMQQASASASKSSYASPSMREGDYRDINRLPFEEQKSIYSEMSAAQAARRAPATPPPSPVAEMPLVSPESTQDLSQLSVQAQLAKTVFESLNGDLRLTKQALIDTGYGAKEAEGFMSEAGLGVPAKSLKELRQEATQAKGAIDGSKESIEKFKDAQSKVNAVNKEVKASLGEEEHAYGSLGNLVVRQAERIAVGIAIWTTLRTVQQEIQQTIQAMEEYSVAVARFAAITDQSIGDAVAQYRILRNEAANAGYTPTEAGSGILEAARFQKNPEAQQELFGTAAKLSEALGLKDTKQATEALGQAELATGKSATEMADMVYAGYKRVGGDATQFMSVLPSINALADEMGTTFEKTFALITTGASASGQSMSTVYQSVNRFSENIGTLDGDKLLSFINGFKSMGIEVTNANGSLKSTGDIFNEIGAQWDKLSSEQQSKVIDLLGGDKVKGTARTAGMGIMQALASGMADSLGEVQGSLDKATDLIDNSFGAIIKRVKAKTEGMRAEGDTSHAAVTDIATGVNTFFGSLFGGAEGGRQAAKQQETIMSLQQNGIAGAKEDALKQMSGLSKEDLQKAVDEYNSYVSQFGKTTFQDVSAGLITDSDKQNIISTMQDTGQKSSKTFADAFKNVGNLIVDAIKKASPQVEKEAANLGKSAAGAASPRTPQSDFAALSQKYIQDLGAGKATGFTSLQSILPTQPVDLTKMSQDEINQAKALSKEMSLQELEAIREQAIAMGLTASQADALVEARKRELDETVKLLQTQRDMHYESGLEVANLEKANQILKQRQQEEKSNFQFRRLKDVDPSQWGELQSRTQMYDKFLTQIGSPEKSQNINLLLGENNVFKNMNARMTALQLALEDLTKVEKAQLSGTWNIPSGMTAMVPVSSLDVQRWNKGSGGGFDPAALAGIIGATSQSGDQVSSAVKTSGDAIVRAISAESRAKGNVLSRDRRYGGEVDENGNVVAPEKKRDPIVRGRWGGEVLDEGVVNPATGSALKTEDLKQAQLQAAGTIVTSVGQGLVNVGTKVDMGTGALRQLGIQLGLPLVGILGQLMQLNIKMTELKTPPPTSPTATGDKWSSESLIQNPNRVPLKDQGAQWHAPMVQSQQQMTQSTPQTIQLVNNVTLDGKVLYSSTKEYEYKDWNKMTTSYGTAGRSASNVIATR